MTNKPKGEGWKHRVHELPRPEHTIEFCSINGGDIRAAKVRRRAYDDKLYYGIGDDFRLDMGTHLLIPSMTYDYWRYI